MSAVLDISDSDDDTRSSVKPEPVKQIQRKKVNIFSRRFRPELHESDSDSEEGSDSQRVSLAGTKRSVNGLSTAAGGSFDDLLDSGTLEDARPAAAPVQEISDDSEDSDEEAKVKAAPRKKPKLSAKDMAELQHEINQDPTMRRLMELRHRTELTRKAAAEAVDNVDSGVSSPVAEVKRNPSPHSNVQANAAIPAPEKRKITLKMVCINGPKWSKKFKTFMDTPFLHMADWIVKNQGLSGVKFQVDGETLDLSSTPSTLDLEEDDDECQVDVVFQPPG